MDSNNHISEDKREMGIKIIKRFNRFVAIILSLFVIICILIANPDLVNYTPSVQSDSVVNETKIKEPKKVIEIENGIHIKSGLIVDEGWKNVLDVCGRCHSYELVTQNKASREGWKEIIVWMQETQKLQDLGDLEDPILEYLAKNYPPEASGRRKPLDQNRIEWYELED